MLKKIAQVLKENNTFLITTHLHPDGDALGSEIVFLELLEDMGKEVIALNDTPLPSIYKFLPASQKITTKIPSNFKPRVAITLDTPARKRLGRIKDHVLKVPFIINIDHHVSNTYFGNINWVDPQASAVAEQIIRLLQYLKIDIKPSWAVCLYTAIVTDTGSFRYINTTAGTHRMAAKLVERGVNPAEVAQNIYESSSIERIHFIGKVLKNLKVTPDGEIAWVTLRRTSPRPLWGHGTVAPYEKYESDEDIVSYPRSLKSVKIAILFRELKSNRVKISFRSKGTVDVNILAQKFGGGGHPAASGCVVKGRLSSVGKKILEETADYIRSVKCKAQNAKHKK